LGDLIINRPGDTSTSRFRLWFSASARSIMDRTV
jgi:hypothetical protein